MFSSKLIKGLEIRVMTMLFHIHLLEAEDDSLSLSLCQQVQIGVLDRDLLHLPGEDRDLIVKFAI